MKRSRVVLVLNALILVTLLAAAVVLALVVVGGASSAPSISIGTATTQTSGGVTYIVAPVQIGNHGYFSFSDITVDVVVRGASGAQLLAGTLGPLTVAPSQTLSTSAFLAFNTAALSPAALQSLAMVPQNLTVTATIAASVPPFVAFDGTVGAQLKWRAPVSGLTVDQPSFSQYNSTTVEASVPVKFSDDNSYLAVAGTGVVSVLNSTGQKVGSGTVSFDVPPGGQFDQAVVLYVDIPTGQVQSLLTHDQTLNYSAVLTIPTEGNEFTVTEPVTYAWGAPLEGLGVGALSVSPLNATYSSAGAQLVFTDASSFIKLDGTVTGTINDASGTVVGAISPLSVSADPGQPFSATISGVIKNTALGEGSYVIHLTIDTQYGAVDTEATVSA